MDHATKIMWLTEIIKAICEENNIDKRVVLEDFIYQMGKEE